MSIVRKTLIAAGAAAAVAVPLLAAAQPNYPRAERREERREYRQDLRRDRRIEQRAWDRSRAQWWRNHEEFRGYHGRRPGFWFVPRRGYVAVPRAWWGYRWGVGVVVPRIFFGQSFIVTRPWLYGLPPAYPPFRWIYIGGGSVARVNTVTGRIVQIVPNVY